MNTKAGAAVAATAARARIAGHADPNVTLKVYGHLMKGALSEAADLYDPLGKAASGAVR